jgi:hypothetical protein
VIALAALLAGSDLPSRPKLAHLTDQQLTAISAKCHSPRRWLRYGATGELHIRPSRTAKYLQVNCILTELKVRGAEPMGFVGNETAR